jgi:hypothetical protein
MGPAGCHGRCRMGDETMAWDWSFWRRDAAATWLGGMRAEAGGEPTRIEDWQERLIEAGVSQEWVTGLATRLLEIHRDLGRGSAAPLIEGAVLAVQMQASAHADVERQVRDVREVERLLGAFSGELEKLDEVLEVLAAYAQRMRSKPAKRERHTLH